MNPEEYTCQEIMGHILPFFVTPYDVVEPKVDFAWMWVIKISDEEQYHVHDLFMPYDAVICDFFEKHNLNMALCLRDGWLSILLEEEPGFDQTYFKLYTGRTIWKSGGIDYHQWLSQYVDSHQDSELYSRLFRTHKKSLRYSYGS